MTALGDSIILGVTAGYSGKGWLEPLARRGRSRSATLPELWTFPAPGVCDPHQSIATDLKFEVVRCAGTISPLDYHGIIPATKRFAVPYACIVVEFGDAPDALLADCQFCSLT
jgi:hypothetical protein